MDKLTVVHANDLVEASYALSINEMRVIALACTKIDSRKKSGDEITISVKEFAKAYGIENKRIYGDLRDSVSGIMRKPVKLYDYKKEKIVELSWLVKNEYELGEDGSYVILQFSPLISPYLFDLKERFTQINFKYVAKLNTPFSFRLYQWLKKVENMHNAKENNAISIILDVSWMKTQSQLLGKYERWGDFKDYVINPAINKINTETDLSVIWNPIKKGRSVHAVKFSYVVEAATFARPIRPRLYRRPKVLKGSHEEGEWMRKNLSLLLSYKDELKKYDAFEKLDIKDLERIAEYSSIFDREIHESALKEISERRAKKTKVAS